MLQKLFNNKQQKSTKLSQFSLFRFEELAEKNYQIDVNNFIRNNNGDYEEIIKAQEKYINQLKRNYDQQYDECEPQLQKVEILMNERIKLLDEIEGLKIKCNELTKNFALLQQPQQQAQAQKKHVDQDTTELKESLNQIIQDLIKETYGEYEQEDEEEENNHQMLTLFGQIEDAIDLFVENLPKQFQKMDESEELIRLRTQAEKLAIELQRVATENTQLNTLLSQEKTYREKILTQYTQKQEELQLVSANIQGIQESLLKEKERAAHFEKKCQEFQSKGQNLTHEVQNIVEEKEALKKEFLENIRQLQEKLLKYEKENQQLKNQIDEQDQDAQQEEEEILMKWKDFENKLVQEKLKLDLKTKECLRLEDLVKQSKKEIGTLSDENIELQQNIQILNQKRENDKKIIEDQKQKLKKFKEEQSQREDDLNEQILQLELRVKNLQEEIEQNNGNTQMQERNFSMQKDMVISRLESENQEYQLKINDMKQTQIQNQLLINDLKEEINKFRSSIQQLQDKREFAISEIKRLTSLNETLKEQVDSLKIQQIHINPNGNYLQDLDCSYQSSQSRNQEGKMQNVLNYSQSDPRGTRQLNDKKSGKNKGKGFLQIFNKKQQPNIIVKNDLVDRKEAEQILLIQVQDLKSATEQLYKQYLSALISEEKQQLLSIERKINECLKKTQDLLDNIEDLAQVQN